MKYLAAVLLCLLAVPVFAASTTSICLKPYSSATSVTANFQGMRKELPKASNGAGQLFSPDSALSRTYLLGTKTTKCYSTLRTTGDAMAVRYTATTTGTNTPVAVKEILNRVETYFLTLDHNTVGVQ